MASSLFLATSRAEIVKAVRALEAASSAEIVVNVRARCATYRIVDMFVGAIFALGVLIWMFESPWIIADRIFPIATAIGFIVGFSLTELLFGYRRYLVPQKWRRTEVRRAACEAFVGHKIHRTKTRIGILVFVSVFERMVEVVCDLGVPDHSALNSAIERLKSAVGAQPTCEQLTKSLSELEAPLNACLPVGPDDENELPDEPDIA